MRIGLKRESYITRFYNLVERLVLISTATYYPDCSKRLKKSNRRKLFSKPNISVVTRPDTTAFCFARCVCFAEKLQQLYIYGSVFRKLSEKLQKWSVIKAIMYFWKVWLKHKKIVSQYFFPTIYILCMIYNVYLHRHIIYNIYLYICIYVHIWRYFFFKFSDFLGFRTKKELCKNIMNNPQFILHSNILRRYTHIFTNERKRIRCIFYK